jgi:hypothetical protein
LNTALRPLRSLLVLLALALLPLYARAGIADAPGDQLEVSLITYGPGDIYWERFGHDAIELRDRASGEAVNFNYGVFDFDERGFLLNFARGRMRYLMDAAPSAEDMRYYVDSGRSVDRQRLALAPAQAAALRDFLLWNLRPEHRQYDYDYYTDNCTTRVRDALDRVLGGALRQALSARPGGLTYRQQTTRLMSNQAWLMLVLDLGLGPYADQPLDGWWESFLPMVLQDQLRGVRIADGQGGQRPLLQDETQLAPERLVPPPAQAPDLRLPLFAAGLAFAAVLLFAARRLPLLHALLGSLYLLLAGLVGLLLIVLWAFTLHRSAWANANLLLFDPLAWLLLPALWRARRGLAATGLAGKALALQLLAVLAALVLHLMPGTVQQNQPWLLFALPVWLALAWNLRKGLRRLG